MIPVLSDCVDPQPRKYVKKPTPLGGRFFTVMSSLHVLGTLAGKISQGWLQVSLSRKESADVPRLLLMARLPVGCLPVATGP